jgi:hypothetical protein
MSMMSLPGFTADVSLYRTKFHYQTVGALERVNGVSPQTGCAALGEACSSSTPCCIGFCGEDGFCDCLAVGDPCQIGPWGCCTGQCGNGGTCVPPAVINVYWAPFGDGRRGIVIVTGHGFTPNAPLRLFIDPCDQVGPPPRTNDRGEFTTWAQCDCGRPISVSACGDPNSIRCTDGVVQTPCY